MAHGREGASLDPVNTPRILTESRTLKVDAQRDTSAYTHVRQ